MVQTPFKVGGAVEPPYFVGRQQELARLANDLRGLTQNNLILAPRRYGKSSLLHNLKLAVRGERDLLVPYVNCREMAGYTDFYEVTIAALLSEYERKRKISGLWDVFKRVFKDKILSVAQQLDEVGGSIAEVGKLYLRFREKDVDERELVKNAFRFFRNLAQEKGLKVVFLLDEFQEVAAFNRFIFNLLKKELDLPSSVRYFFSGSSMSLLSEIFLREDSPLYLMVGKYAMEPLGVAETADFVTSRLRVVSIDIDPRAAELFHPLTGGIPFYIQKLGITVVQETLFKGEAEVGAAEVDHAFATMLDELDGEFEVRWLARFSNLQRQILKVLADVNEAGLTDVAGQMGRRATDISSSLTRLKEMLIVRKVSGGGYAIVDAVFAAWLGKPQR